MAAQHLTLSFFCTVAICPSTDSVSRILGSYHPMGSNIPKHKRLLASLLAASSAAFTTRCCFAQKNPRQKIQSSERETPGPVLQILPATFQYFRVCVVRRVVNCVDLWRSGAVILSFTHRRRNTAKNSLTRKYKVSGLVSGLRGSQYFLTFQC